MPVKGGQMAGAQMTWADKLARRRMMRRWKALAARAPELTAPELRGLRDEGRGMGRAIDRVLQEADYRLALPAIGSNAIRRQPGTDWAWRPMPWRAALDVAGQAAIPVRTGVGEGVTLYHDCRRSELTLRQVRNGRDSDLAAFGLRLDVFGFDGSFLSLAVELPGDVGKGLTRRHMIRLEARVEMEKPLQIYGRLNLRHGPNVEQLLRELPKKGEEVFVDFDLSQMQFDEKRVEHLWLDLILEGPQMNQVTFRDVTLARRLRAGM
jgi:hypothetical protein